MTILFASTVTIALLVRSNSIGITFVLSLVKVPVSFKGGIESLLELSKNALISISL